MLSSKQRAKLASMGQSLDPVVRLGRSGPTEGLLAALDKALDDHELVKLAFVDFKDERRDMAVELATATKSELVRSIGNVVLLYRPNSDPDARKIVL